MSTEGQQRPQDASTEVPTVATEARAAEAPAGDAARDAGSAAAGRVGELEDRWRRAAADLENLRKRFAREVERDREAEKARIARAWLPVLDHLELALANADADPRSIVAGVRAVRDQAVDVLDRLGYPRHDEVGVPFDPARHDALSVVEEPGMPPGTVVDVVRPGYGDGGRQLRPVGVAVSRPPADDADGGQRSPARPGSPQERAPGPQGREPGRGGRDASGSAE
ncbi:MULTISPECIES: nucleotide exchange factor GrpE [unclassified Pseudofrankia]|uniref:nucleotide exchange factor GrpE n=1 Tax=unclassified Pseudofrankia TaxID=2994372 RepID=UPI0009F1DA56|nr:MULTISPECIES: nucleotide exchange factor GrpE [unclassified Pseudofrankia]MDT3439983.1 nucleotide exchange factor GrpE [Pseudofrankia sp. BMG5.37]